MNERIKYLYLLMAAAGFILDCIDHLQGMNFFTNKIKQVTNRFIKELEKLENLVSQDVDADIMSESYEVFGNVLGMSLTIDQKKKKSFNREITEVLKKYEKPTKASNTNESK